MSEELTALKARNYSDRIRDQFLKADGEVAELRLMVLDFDRRKGWEKMGHPDFETWAKECLPWHRARCFRILQEAKIEEPILNLLPIPLSGRQLRMLKDFNPDERVTVIGQVIDASKRDKGSGEPIVLDSTFRKQVRNFKLSAPAVQDGDQVSVDGRGSALKDPDMQALFAAAPAFDAVLGSLGRLKTSIEGLVKGPAGLMIRKEASALEVERGNLYRIIKFGKPYAVCIWCRGTGQRRSKTCQACKGHRVVNQMTLEKGEAAAKKDTPKEK